MNSENIFFQNLNNLTNIPPFPPKRIQELMKTLSIKEKAFAVLIGVEPSTVRKWLRGAERPCNLARRILQYVEMEPDIMIPLIAKISNTKQK